MKKVKKRVIFRPGIPQWQWGKFRSPARIFTRKVVVQTHIYIVSSSRLLHCTYYLLVHRTKFSTVPHIVLTCKRIDSIYIKLIKAKNDFSPIFWYKKSIRLHCDLASHNTYLVLPLWPRTSHLLPTTTLWQETSQLWMDSTPHIQMDSSSRISTPKELFPQAPSSDPSQSAWSCLYLDFDDKKTLVKELRGVFHLQGKQFSFSNGNNVGVRYACKTCSFKFAISKSKRTSKWAVTKKSRENWKVSPWMPLL